MNKKGYKIAYRKFRHKFLKVAVKRQMFGTWRKVRLEGKNKVRKTYFYYCMYAAPYNEDGKIPESVYIDSPIVADINEVLRQHKAGETYLFWENNKLVLD